MQEAPNARQQIVERVRQATSILVAVGNNPSVDALAASLGLSLMLNKMNKHTTTVFSGQIPPAMQFLEPSKTFESNVDALRDFIISLDKEKADRLRYKVEDDVVRIFITPYRTSITEKDLQYSQGDFNVDLIVALGVEKREDLDKAVIAHGRILHDATVITINANGQHSSLGAIDWNDSTASSLCEMLVSMSEAFQQPGLLDAQISTALLTGIVAATDRFSNPHTSPRVMTMAAQLMAAGANQQLIATNLAKNEVPKAEPTNKPVAMQEGGGAPKPMAEEVPKAKPDGELDIAHPKDKEPKKADQQPPKPNNPQQDLPKPAAPKPQQQPKPEPKPVPEPAPAPMPEPAPKPTAEDELAAALPSASAATHAFADLKDQIENANKDQQLAPEEPKTPGSSSVNDGNDEEEPAHEEEYLSSHGSWKGKRLEPPSMGGTLNATTEEAMVDASKAQEQDRNQKILTHPEVAPAEPVALPTPPPPLQFSEPALVAEPPHTAPVEPPVAPPPAIVTPPKEEPAPAPAPKPEPKPAPEPAPAPQPAPVEPPAQPAPAAIEAPTLEPAAAPLPEPDLDALHKDAAGAAAEAAAVAQPASTIADEVSSAQQAVSDAYAAEPFKADNNPAKSVGAQPVPAMPDIPVSEPLSPEALQALPPAPTAPAPITPTSADLPPLPPMPPLPQTGTELPPAPDLPGLSQPLPPLSAPPVSPSPAPDPTAPPAPADPAQFKIPGAS